MTVTSTQIRFSYTGDGVTTTFPITVAFYLASDIEVLLAGTPISTGYSVAGGGTGTPLVPGTGSVVMATAPTGGASLQILINVPLTQIVALVDGTGFPSATLNQINDRAVFAELRLQDQLNRTLRAPDGDVLPAMSLPLAAGRANQFVSFDSNGNLLLASTGPGTSNTQATLGPILNPQTQAEVSTSATPTAYVYQGLEFIDVLRYGIVPNNASAATANTTALIALCNPSNTGPTGRLIFPNTTGADIYYFNNIVQVRDGLRWDLQWCTLNFSKTYASSDDCFGFLTFIRDVSIENGTIVVNYTGQGGNVPGPVMRIGGRSGGVAPTYTFGSITPANFYEANFALPMGNIGLKNLRITTNNAQSGGGTIHMLGGLQNVSLENIYINGSGIAAFGIYYEFGYWSQNGAPATPSLWTSAHGRNLNFKNINVTNMVAAGIGADGGGIGLTGSYSWAVDGLFVDTAYNGFEFRPGEALFYRVGPTDAVGAKRGGTLRNIVCQNITSTGLQLTGAELALAYLAPVIGALPLPQQYAAQTDLMVFSVDGFAISAGTSGINVSGPCDIRNGVLNGTSSSGQIIIQDECTRFALTNVQVLNSSSIGIRANFGGAIWSPPRRKIGTIDDCLVAGNTGPGLTLANSKAVKVRCTRFGYNTLYDVANEATQTNAISVDATNAGGGVSAEDCFVTTSGGALAYATIGSVTQLLDCCNISRPKGTVTYSSGFWDIDGVAQVTQAIVGPDAGSKNSYINNLNGTAGVSNKYKGKIAYDTTNNRVLIATGPNATDPWERVDGGTSVTPS